MIDRIQDKTAINEILFSRESKAIVKDNLFLQEYYTNISLGNGYHIYFGVVHTILQTISPYKLLFYKPRGSSVFMDVDHTEFSTFTLQDTGKFNFDGVKFDLTV